MHAHPIGEGGAVFLQRLSECTLDKDERGQHLCVGEGSDSSPSSIPYSY